MCSPSCRCLLASHTEWDCCALPRCPKFALTHGLVQCEVSDQYCVPKYIGASITDS